MTINPTSEPEVTYWDPQNFAWWPGEGGSALPPIKFATAKAHSSPDRICLAQHYYGQNPGYAATRNSDEEFRALGFVSIGTTSSIYSAGLLVKR